MTSLSEHLELIADQSGKPLDEILEKAAIFLATYGCEDIDTSDGRRRYYQVYYGMASPEDRIKQARELADKANRKIRSLKQSRASAKGEERDKIKGEIRQAQKDWAYYTNETLRLDAVLRYGYVRDEDLDQDWGSIVELRGLRAIRYEAGKSGEYPVFLFRIYYVYDGNIYDFGDIEVNFNPAYNSSDTRIAMRTRITAFPEWGQNYPNYSYSGEGGRKDRYPFCFGSERETIQEYRDLLRFTDVLLYMVFCFHSVRDEHLAKIPKCFPELEVDDATVISALDNHLKEEGIIW